jgi:hypothetical protein
MIRYNRYFVIAIVLFITGCEYAFVDESDIKGQLELLTAIGTSNDEVTHIVNEAFGAQSFVFAGSTEHTADGWKSGGVRFAIDSQMLEGSYFFTYKLGSHMSEYIILQTHVFASWYFDDKGRLVEIRVIKQVDGL